MRVFLDWPRPSETGDRKPPEATDSGVSFEAGFRSARSHAVAALMRVEGAAGRVRDFQIMVSPDGTAQVQELKRVEPRFDTQGPNDTQEGEDDE